MIEAELKKILTKTAKFCAYRERSQKEVREYLLYRLKVYGQDVEWVLSQLIEQNFLNELRYAKSYARGKFYFNQWGRDKIIRNLKKQDISNYCLNKALEEIDEDDYNKVLLQLIDKKAKTLNDDNIWLLKQKISHYLSQKGFENHLVYEAISEYFRTKS